MIKAFCGTLTTKAAKTKAGKHGFG